MYTAYNARRGKAKGLVNGKDAVGSISRSFLYGLLKAVLYFQFAVTFMELCYI